MDPCSVTLRPYGDSFLMPVTFTPPAKCTSMYVCKLKSLPVAAVITRGGFSMFCKFSKKENVVIEKMLKIHKLRVQIMAE